ncbi:MAG: DUF7619 domain-containing protein [Adhaeribacter sp.]
MLNFTCRVTLAQGSCGGGGSQSGPYGGAGTAGPEGGAKEYEWEVQLVHSSDPNDIIGPQGFQEKQWVAGKDKLKYTIRFENNPEFATAPAQNVYVNLPVDPKININSLRLSDFGFWFYNFKVPENSTFYTKRLDVRDSLNVYVDVTAGIDIAKNEVFWIFQSIDPITGLAPTNALDGFLPVNDTTITRFNDNTPKKGEGFVSFIISPKKTAATQDTVRAQATIIFDTNEPIPTNTWVNTIDAVAPSSEVQAFTVSQDTVKLSWAGQDDVNGTGVREYALYASENQGPYKLQKQSIAGTSTAFVGTPGSTYRFYTLATDNVGNVELPLEKQGLPVTLAALGSSDPPLPVTWLSFKGKQQDQAVMLSWITAMEKNTREFVVERSVDGNHFKPIGKVRAAGNSQTVRDYGFLDHQALGLGVPMLYYRLQQVDLDERSEYSAIISIPLQKGDLGPVVQAFPNPFRDRLSLRIISVLPSDRHDQVELFSLNGTRLYQRNLADRNQQEEIPLKGLPALASGVYLLRVYLNNSLYIIKVMRE